MKKANLTRGNDVSFLVKSRNFASTVKNLASQIERNIADYDKDLARLRKLIGEVLYAENMSHASLSDMHEVQKGWFDSFDGILSSIVQNLKCAEEIVASNAFKEKIPNEYLDKLARCEGILGCKIETDDVSQLVCLSRMFRERDSEIPKLETDDKFQEYVQLAKLIPVINDIREAYSLFGVWLHDSRHFLDRIQVLSKPSWSNYISVGDLKALDAMESALYVVRQSSRCCLISHKTGVNHPPFEPYKLFHKYQYCFSLEFDRIEWQRGEESFIGKLQYVDGFESVVLNIYTNAAKYIPRDDSVHAVSTAFKLRDDALYIEVSSLGPYVEEDELEKIFDNGVRGKNANIGSTSGSGRGLASVKNICKAAGYSVFAKSIHVEDWDEKWGLFTIIIKIPRDLVIV